MSLCPTPTWRPPHRLYIKIAPALLLCLACGKAPPPADDGKAVVVAPATAPPSAPPTAPPAPPPSQPHATLFTGAEPAVPAVFEGLMPGMPLLVARVLFPQLPGNQVISAPYAGLRFTVYITGEQVSRLGIKTLKGAPAGAELRTLLVNQWQAGTQVKDDSARVLTVWHVPQTGLRVIHQAEADGSAHVFFEAFTPLSKLTGVTLPTLQAQIGRTPAQVVEAFEGAVLADAGVAVPLPALAFGQAVTARLIVGEGDAAKTVHRVEFDLSFFYKPAFKGEILRALTGSSGRAQVDKSKREGFIFKWGTLEAKADRWRVTLR